MDLIYRPLPCKINEETSAMAARLAVTPWRHPAARHWVFILLAATVLILCGTGPAAAAVTEELPFCRAGSTSLLPAPASSSTVDLRVAVFDGTRSLIFAPLFSNASVAVAHVDAATGVVSNVALIEAGLGGVLSAAVDGPGSRFYTGDEYAPWH